GLRQITRPSAYHSQLALPAEEDPHSSPNRIAVRFCSHKLKSNAAVSSLQIISIQVRRPIIRRHKQIQVPVAVEVSIGEAASYDRSFKAAAKLPRHVPEFSAAFIQEKLRRLRITDVAVNISHSFVDVPICHGQVQPAVQVNVEKSAAKPQRVP